MGVERLTQLSGLYFGQIEKIIPVPQLKKIMASYNAATKNISYPCVSLCEFFTFILCIILNLRRSVKVTAFI